MEDATGSGEHSPDSSGPADGTTTPLASSNHKPNSRLPRRLGPLLLTLYGVGVMVGAGIYVLVGTVAGNAGILAPLAFLAAGLVAAPTAMSYAELSVRMPESSGEATYVRAAFNATWPSVVVGLTIVFVGTTSAAAVLRGGVGYLQSLIDLPTEVLIVAVAVVLLLIALWGVLESLALAGVITILEVVGLVLVIQAGWVSTPTDAWKAGWPAFDAIPWAGLGLSMVLAFFAFIGFEDIVNLAEEVKRPHRTLPIAILGSLIIAAVLYGGVSIAALRAVDPQLLSDSEQPLSLVYERSGRNGEVLSAIAAVAALNGVLAQLVMASRMLFGLGRRARPLAVFTHVHPRFGTPVLATVTIGVAVVAAALTLNVGALAETTSTVLLVVFMIVNVALIVLKRRDARQLHADPTLTANSDPVAAPQFSVPTVVPWLGFVGSAAAFAVAVVA